jgi:hypothetical protein
MAMPGLGIIGLVVLAGIVWALVRAINGRGRASSKVLLAVGLAVAAWMHLRTIDSVSYFGPPDAMPPIMIHPELVLAPAPPPVARQVVAAEPLEEIPLEREPIQPIPVAGFDVPMRVSAERPNWVGTAARPMADGSYRVAVVTDPYVPDAPEAQMALARELERAVGEYIDVIGAKLGEAETKSRIRLPLEYIQSRLIADTWQEPYHSPTESIGTMVRLNVLLRFDADDQRDILRRCREAVIRDRLWHAGSYVGLGLVVLAALFGYLKLDTATRGFYTGRLKAAAGAVIAAALAAGALLATGKIGLPIFNS